MIWVWLGGGPTQIETFGPKMTSPSEYRSVTGEVQTVLPGVTFGGNFERIGQVADRMAFVRSFAHTNSGHSGGTHCVMTGYDNRLVMTIGWRITVLLLIVHFSVQSSPKFAGQITQTPVFRNHSSGSHGDGVQSNGAGSANSVYESGWSANLYDRNRQTDRRIGMSFGAESRKSPDQ